VVDGEVHVARHGPRWAHSITVSILVMLTLARFTDVVIAEPGTVLSSIPDRLCL
jgi:hypothetical protein